MRGNEADEEIISDYPDWDKYLKMLQMNQFDHGGQRSPLSRSEFYQSNISFGVELNDSNQV